MLADEMGEFLGTRTVREVRAEMEALGPWQGSRAAAPAVEAGEVPSVEAGTLVLATWRHLLDRGSLQDGEPFLAGTAPSPVARVSASTAGGLGVVDGDDLTVRRRATRTRHRPGAGRPRWPTTSSGSRPTPWAATCGPRSPARRGPSSPSRRRVQA